MLTRSLTVLTICLLALLAAGCPASKKTAPNPTAGTPTTQSVLPASRSSFAQQSLYHVHSRTETSANTGSFEVDAWYTGSAVSFSHYVATGSIPNPDEASEFLFLPPDLYMRVSGGWFILSPWNQGNELDQDPNEPLIDYDTVSRGLRNLESLPDEEIAGRTDVHYHGEILLSDLLPGEGLGGTAQADVWIDKNSDLPSKLEFTFAANGISAMLIYEFLDYGTPATVPAAPENPRPWRDLELPGASCSQDVLAGCLPALTELQSISTTSCGANGKQVCLAPLGQISPEVVSSLVDYYQNQYGLSIAVLTPSAIPESLVDPARDQIDASALIDYMESVFPDAEGNSNAVLIGVTPIDLYPHDPGDFRYVFGVKGALGDPKAVLSTFRMDPNTYGAVPDEDLLKTRARKLLSKYIGYFYYGLPLSSDPTSPMYDSIGGLDDLDAMHEPLQVASQGR